MFKKFFNDHQYKIIFGAPIIFLLIINSASTLGVGNIFYFTHASSDFVIAGEESEVTLFVRSKSAINALGGTVTFTPGLLEMNGLSRISSLVDLWSEEPTYTKEENMLHFSGGMIGEKSELPAQGIVLKMNIKALQSGVATIAIMDGQLLASNGEGTNILSGSDTLTLYIRDANVPSPDINGDGVLSLQDVNSLYLKTFRAYDKRYDLNLDNKVSWPDVRTLLGLF